MQRFDTIIVGAGASGLSAAWRLERLGAPDFMLLELEPGAGGTAAYGTDGVVPYPWGAHYVPLPQPSNRMLSSLLAELGIFTPAAGEPPSLPLERARVREPEERLFMDGTWHEGLFPFHGASDADRAQLSRFEAEVARWVAFRDARGRRAFVLPTASCSDDAEVTALDRMTGAEWFAKSGFDSPRLRWYLEYGCRDDYGLTLEQISAWTLLFYFAARVAEPGADSSDFITWPEGNGHLIKHFERIVGNRLRNRQLVTDIVPEPEQVLLSAYDVASGRLLRYAARHVILAIPKFVARRVLRPWREAPPVFLDEFSYGSWMVANLHLKARPTSRGFPLAWDNVIYDSPSLGYVVATHQALRDRGPSIWTYYLPLTQGSPSLARRELAAADHASLTAAVLTDLGRAHDDLDECIERVDIWRWGHAMIRPVPGFMWGQARQEAHRPFQERIHFAHSDLSGVALFEEAQAQGVRAAEAVLARQGRSFETLTG